jgi:hypothetical protein
VSRLFVINERIAREAKMIRRAQASCAEFGRTRAAAESILSAMSSQLDAHRIAVRALANNLSKSEKKQKQKQKQAGETISLSSLALGGRDTRSMTSPHASLGHATNLPELESTSFNAAFSYFSNSAGESSNCTTQRTRHRTDRP